jgi:transcriptional regulator with XRE-family HTH domain
MDTRSLETLRKFAGVLGVEEDYFLEVRLWKAEQRVRGLMLAGLLDLEDLEEIAARLELEERLREEREE